MIGAAKRKSISPPGLSALWSILLLVVALCLPETRVWGFGISTPPASGVFESASPSSIGENTIAWRYDASGSPVAANAAPKIIAHGHHPIPKFLGGNQQQVLTGLDRSVHTEFHSLLRQNLKDAGIPLNVGGRGGSAADWARYFNANPGSQRTALDAVLDSSRAIDYKHGTQITRDVWQNSLDGSFQVFP